MSFQVGIGSLGETFHPSATANYGRGCLKTNKGVQGGGRVKTRESGVNILFECPLKLREIGFLMISKGIEVNKFTDSILHQTIHKRL